MNLIVGSLTRILFLILFAVVVLGLVLQFALVNVVIVASIVVFLIFIVLMCAYSFGKLSRGLLQHIFSVSDFEQISKPSPLEGFYIGEHEQHRVHDVYKQQHANMPAELIRFSINRSASNSTEIYDFIGFLFTTHDAHYQIQMRNVASRINPFGMEKRALEGVDFNEWFSVYSKEAEAGFHFFDPDTMADLIDLRVKIGLPFSIDTIDNKILIFFEEERVRNYLGDITWFEIFTGKLRNSSQQGRVAAAKQFLSYTEDIMRALDHSLKK